MERFGWQCYVFHLPGKGNGTCLHEQHKDPSSGTEYLSSEVLMATLKTAVSQEFLLTFFPPELPGKANVCGQNFIIRI